MSITINDAQHLLNPVRNPVEFDVTTDAAYSGSGVANMFSASFDEADMPSDGDTLQFEWNGNAVLFTFRTSPTEPNDIRAYVSGNGQTWVDTYVLPVLQANYLLSNDFMVMGSPYTPGYGFFLLQAYNTGPDYYVTAVEGGTWALVGDMNSGGSLATLQDNFKLLTELWVEQGYGSNSFSKVLEEELDVDADGNLKADIAKVLRSYVNSPEAPNPTTVTGEELTGQFTRFYLRYGEKYGDPATVQSAMKLGDTRWAYLAGRSEPARIATPDWVDAVLPSGVAKVLSAWPNTSEAYAKWVLPAQREFITYIVPEGITSGRLRVDIYYHDGTSTLSHVVEALGDWDEYELWCCHVGVEARALDAVDATKTISHYCAYLTIGSGTTVISERRWYRVRYDHVQHFRQLHYLNSQGGWDTMPLYGPRSENFAAEKMLSGRTTLGGSDLHAVRDTSITLERFNTELQAGTCHLRNDEMDALQELLGSELVVERVNGAHWPVELLDKDMPGRNEQQPLAGRVISYRYALRNTAHS